MGRLSLKRHAASGDLGRLVSRAVLAGVAALGLTACAYSDPHHRSYSYHSHGYGYGGGTRVAMGQHRPDAVYRTHGNRVHTVKPRRHAVVPGSHHVIIPGGHYVTPRPGYRHKPPHVAPRPGYKPAPPHAASRSGYRHKAPHAAPRSAYRHKPPRAASRSYTRPGVSTPQARRGHDGNHRPRHARR